MWLLEKDFAEELSNRYECTARPSQLSRVEAVDPLTVDKSIGRIKVAGVLSKTPDPFLKFLGYENTTYSDIIGAVERADSDPRINSIELYFDSPGGEVCADFFTAMETVRNVKKPTHAIVSDISASASYGLTSQCSKITATSPGVRVGSIGVVTTRFINKSRVDITSTNAPNKRPDAGTEEGVDAIKAELDQLHELFVDSIAKGRKTSADDVNSNFGRGSMLLASEAQKKGMIDAIGFQQSSEKDKEYKAMDKQELMAKHPELYAECISEGVEKERGRVRAHLKFAEHGDTEFVHKCITEGKGVDDEVIATHQSAILKNTLSASRKNDEAELTAADQDLDTSAKGDDTPEADKTFLAMLNERYGLKEE